MPLGLTEPSRDVTVREVLVSPIFGPTYANGADYTEEDKAALIDAFETAYTGRQQRLGPWSTITDAEVKGVRLKLRGEGPPEAMFMEVFAPSGPTEKQRGLMMVLQYLSTYDWKGWTRPLYPVPVTPIEQVTLDYVLRLLCAKQPTPPFANGNWLTAITKVHGTFRSLTSKKVFSHAVREFAIPILEWGAQQCKSFQKLGTPPWSTLCWCTLRLGCTVPLYRTVPCCTVPIPASLLPCFVPYRTVP